MATYQDYALAFAKGESVVEKPGDIIGIYNQAAKEWDLDFYKWLCRQIGKDAPPDCFIPLFSNCLVEHIKFVLDYIPSIRTMGESKTCSRQDVLDCVSRAELSVNVASGDIIEYCKFMRQIAAPVDWNNEERIVAINKIINIPEVYDICLMIVSEIDDEANFKPTGKWRHLLIDCNILKEPYTVEDAKYLFDNKTRSPFWLDQIFMAFRKQQTQEFTDYIIVLNRENDYYLSKRYGFFIGGDLDDETAMQLFSNGFVFGNPDTTSETVINFVQCFNRHSVDLILLVHEMVKNKFPKFLSAFTLALNGFFSSILSFEEIKLICEILGDQLDFNSPDLWDACANVEPDHFTEMIEIFKDHPDKQDHIAGQIIRNNDVEKGWSPDLSKFKAGPYTLKAFYVKGGLRNFQQSHWPRKEDFLEYFLANPRDHVSTILYLYNNLSHAFYDLLHFLPIPAIIRLDGTTVHVASKSYTIAKNFNMFIQVNKQCNSCEKILTCGVFRNPSNNHGIYYCTPCASFNRAIEEIMCAICMSDEEGLSFNTICGHAVCRGCLPKLKACPLCNGPLSEKTKAIAISTIVEELSL